MTSRSFARALLAASALGLAALPAPAGAQRVDRITAFGDSYADEGNLWQLLGIAPPVVYGSGRFSGGTNYIDTLGQIYGVTPENFAIGGALTGNSNTNSPFLPGFAFQWNSFLAGGGGVFPAVAPTFGAGDLVTISVGGNDARFYQQTGGTLAGAQAAATISVGQATAGLNALVNAGAPTISFLAGNTAILPEIAGDPNAQAIRNAFSTAFNAGIQPVLAGYAANGVMVHYLDLTLIGQQITANPAAYGLQSAGACAPAPQCVADSAYANRFLFYVDNLHLSSRGFEIVGQYVATQLQAPLTMQVTSDLALDSARQFGRTLTSRLDLSAPRDGDLAEGTRFFIVGDMFNRDVRADSRTDAFDIDGRGVTAGVAYGWGNGVAGIAANVSQPKAVLGADVAETSSDVWQVGGFAGMTIAGGFAQGYAGYGRDKHDIRRSGVVEGMRARPDGSHWLAGAKAGYLMPLGTVRVGPVLALDYASAKVDSYTESGDPALTLNVGSVSARALTASLGAELRGDFLAGRSQLRPFAAAAIEKDLLGDGRTIRFAQTSAPTIVNSWQLEDRSKKAYGRLSVGGSAELIQQVSLNAIASGTVGRDDGNEISGQLGLRFGF